jgi:hypothetical protein
MVVVRGGVWAEAAWTVSRSAPSAHEIVLAFMVILRRS